MEGLRPSDLTDAWHTVGAATVPLVSNGTKREVTPTALDTYGFNALRLFLFRCRVP